MKVLVVISVFVLAIEVYQTSGLCNTCFENTGIACAANDSFSICVEGVPQWPPTKCPRGTVCSGAQICSSAATSKHSCENCNICDRNNVFACIGYNAFALCGGNVTYDQTMQYNCPGDLVCSISSSNICVDPLKDGLGATCPWIENSNPPSTFISRSKRDVLRKQISLFKSNYEKVLNS